MQKKSSKKSQEDLLDDLSFLSNLDKVYWRKEGITKGDLLKYYAEISSFILPYLIDRPESLRRFPEGIEGEHFFQKNVTNYPDWLQTIEIEHTDKMVNYLLVQDFASLLYEVNLGCIEIHPFLSHIPTLAFPDFAIFDLDPIDLPFDRVIEVALELHQILDELNIPSYVKTSGSRGMHVLIPLGAKYTFDDAKNFAHLIALYLHERLPGLTSLERMPERRQKKVYIDYLQNNPHQTIAAPYSVRAKPGAPVSTPLEWHEIKKGLDPLDYNLFTLPTRLKKKGDCMKGLLSQKINIEKTLKSL